MPSRSHTVVKRLPLWAWLLSVVASGGLALCCASLALSGEQPSPFIRILLGVFGTLFFYLVRRGGGWARLQKIGQVLQNWGCRGRISEHVAVYVLSVGLAAVLCSVFTHCKDRNAREQASVSHLKLCGLGMLQYAHDYDDNLPSQRGDGALRNSLAMYVPIHDPKDDVFQDPLSGRPFVWRQHMGDQNLGHVANAEAVIVAYSPVPSVSKRPQRAALFLDGHARMMYEDVFQRSRHVNPEYGQNVSANP